MGSLYQVLFKELQNNKIFKKLRPFSSLTHYEIFTGGLEAFEKEIKDIEIATLALNELQTRFQKNHKDKINNSIKTLKDAFQEHQRVPIPWLKEAREIVSRLKNLGDIGKGKHNTYVILIDGFSNQKGTYGVYVGETSQSPEERFKEHQAGIRSGKGTKDRSIQLMRSLMPFTNFRRKNKDYYETYLHQSLAQTMIKEPYYLRVNGNTELKISELPKKLQLNLTGLE